MGLENFRKWAAENSLAVEDDTRSEFRKGISAGIDQVQASGGGLLSLASDLVGFDRGRDYGLEVYQRNMEEAAQSAPRVGRYEDVESFGDFLDYAAHGVGSGLATTAPAILSGGTGGLVGKKLATSAIKELAEREAKKAVAKSVSRGVALGGATGSAGIEAGLLQGDIREETGETSPGKALAAGIVAGSLDAIPVGALFRRLGVGEIAKEGIANTIAESVPAFILKQAAREGSTESLQTIIERGAIKWAGGHEDIFSSEGISEIANATILGSISGGAIATPTGILTRARKQVAEEGGDALDQELEASAEFARALDGSIPYAAPDIPVAESKPADLQMESVDYEPVDIPVRDFGLAEERTDGIDFVPVDRIDGKAGAIETLIADREEALKPVDIDPAPFDTPLDTVNPAPFDAPMDDNDLASELSEAEQRLAEEAATKLPPGLKDPRLRRQDFRLTLEEIANNRLQSKKEGNTGLIVDDNPMRISAEYGGTPMKNSSSVNPDWFQAFKGQSVESGRAAVQKALRGERLGTNEADFVATILDEIQREYNDSRLPEIKDRLQKRRDAIAIRSFEDYFKDNDPFDATLPEESAVAEALNDAEDFGVPVDKIDVALQLDDSFEALAILQGEIDALRQDESARVSEADAEYTQSAARPEEKPEAQAEEQGKLSPTEKSKSPPQDLFGATPEKEQTLADVVRAKKEKRDGKEDVPADIDGGLFSNQSKQADLTDTPISKEQVEAKLDAIDKQGRKVSTKGKRGTLAESIKQRKTPEKAEQPAKESSVIDVLGQTKAQFVSAQIKANGVKKGSPGFESRKKGFRSDYETAIDKAQATLPFEQYKQLNDGPETLVRASYDGLREEFGITDTVALDDAVLDLMLTKKPATLAQKREQKKAIENKANEAATSPENDLPEPTDAQKEAGNYKKGHVTVQGIDIAIENPKGSERSGIDPDGKKWSVTMKHHYGDIKRTDAADGDNVDVFIGPNPDSQKVFIVDQVNQDGGFDEHKVMLGFDSEKAAIDGYKSNYSKGWKVGPVTEMSVDEFKAWLQEGDTTKPVQEVQTAEPEATQKEEKPAANQNDSPGPVNTVNTETKTLKEKVAKANSDPKDLKGGPYTLDHHNSLIKRVKAGDITAKEFIESFETLIANEAEIKARANKYNKDQLFGMATGYRDNSMKKGELVDRLFERMKNFYTLEMDVPSFSFMFGDDVKAKRLEHENKINEIVRSATQADLDAAKQAFEDTARARKEREAEYGRALTDPQTLSEFNTFIDAKGIDKLSADQLALYDALVSDKMDEARKNRLVRESAVQSFDAGDLSYETVEAVHTKKGHDLFIVKMTGERLPSERFKELNGKAKKLGGYYSSFRGAGAIPGFQFRSDEDRANFIKLLGGEDVNFAEQAEQRAKEKAMTRSERLMAKADEWESKGEEKLNQDRQTNTARRAGMAASAEADARDVINNARMMRAIAQGISDGTVTAMGGVQAATHIDAIRATYRRKKHSKEAEHLTYKDGNSNRYWKEDANINEIAKIIDWPKPYAYTGVLNALSRTMGEKKGFVMTARQIDKALAKYQGKDDQNHNLEELFPRNWPQIKGKITEFLKKYPDSREAERIKSTFDDDNRLNRAGITDISQLRQAVREYLRIFRSIDTAKADPITAKERELIGKKDVGLDFFPTPDGLIGRLMEEADIDSGMKVLEPSAGKGDIADALKEAGADVDVVELSGTLREFLELKSHNIVGDDFETFEGSGYDRVVMNPPFSNDLDIQHVRRAYDMLKPGGRLVAIVSGMAGRRQRKSNSEFIEWLEGLDGTMEPLPEGSFKSSFRPTGVSTQLIVLDKKDSTLYKLDTTTGTSIGKEQTVKVVGRILAGWRNRPGVTVVDNESQLPKKVQAQIEKDGAKGQVNGVFHEGQVYVVAEKMRSAEQVETVILHEIQGHYGLRQANGKEIGRKLDAVMKGLGGWDGVLAYAKKHNINLNAYSRSLKDADLPQDQKDKILTEELLAHLQENTKGVMRSRVKQLIGAIKQWLRDNGFLELAKYSDSDIAKVLGDARRAVETGPKIDAKAETRFSAAEENRQAEAKGLDMSTEARMQRARDMGFDTSRVLYHGSERTGFTEFDSDFMESDGFFFTESKSNAATYSDSGDIVRPGSEEQRGIYEVYVRLNDPLEWDFEGRNWDGMNEDGEYDGADTIHEVIALAKDQGRDGVIAKNIIDEGPHGHGYAWGNETHVVFDSKNIRSVHAAFDPDYSESANILYRLEDNVGESAVPDSIRASIDEVVARPRGMRTYGERIKEFVKEHVDTNAAALKQGFIDSFNSIAELEKSVHGDIQDASISAIKAAYRTKNIDSVMGAVMAKGSLELKDGGVQLKEGSKGFLEVFQPLADKGLIRVWEGWAGAVRAKRLMAEGKENNYTAEQIAEIIDYVDSNPETKELFESVQKDWIAFNKSILDFAEAAGLINQEERALWEKDDYVPFHRVAELAEDYEAKGPHMKGGLSGQKSGINKLTGGVEKISPIESMVMNITHLVDASFKNIAMQRITDLAISTGAMEKTADAKLDIDLVKERLEVAGISTKGVTDDQLALWQNQIARHEAAKGTVTVSVNGKPQKYIVHDPMLLRSIGTLGPSGVEGVMKLFRFSKRLLTTGVTSDPSFALRNLLRDTISTWVTVEPKTKPMVDALRGAKKSLENDDIQWSIMAAGAGSGGFYDTSPDDVRAHLSKLNTTMKAPTKVLYKTSEMWKAYQKFLSAGENANRIAVYESVIKSGGTKAEAAHQAQDVLNFSRHGEYKAIRILIEMVPFMNARLQGLDRLYRGAKADPRGFAIKGSILMGATLALLAANWEREEYWELPEWERDTYYHFWADGEHYRLPKPFEVGAIFSTIPERMFEQMREDADSKLLAERMLAMVADTFAFDPTPQLLKPASEVAMNENSFTGSPIVSMGMSFASPEAQYSPYTSETMRLVADAMPDSAPEWARSPVRLQHVFKGYLGTLGAYALQGADWLVAEGIDAPVDPTIRKRDIPVVKSFVRDGVGSTKYSNRVYTMSREANQLYSAIKKYRDEGRAEKADTVFAEHREKLRVRKLLNKHTRQMSKVSTRIKRIYDNREMSAEEKRLEIDELVVRRNMIAKKVADQYWSTFR